MQNNLTPVELVEVRLLKQGRAQGSDWSWSHNSLPRGD